MFLDSFYANPMLYIGLLFTLVGTFGALMFFAGFLAGMPGAISLMAHKGHYDHHTVRATWGVMLMSYTFVLWELARIVASWFGYPPANVHAFGIVITTVLIILAVCWVVVLLTDTITKKGQVPH